ncbi:Zinc-regulated GTPase metalloprotein activator 1 [Linum perenne]
MASMSLELATTFFTFASGNQTPLLRTHTCLIVPKAASCAITTRSFQFSAVPFRISVRPTSAGRRRFSAEASSAKTTAASQYSSVPDITTRIPRDDRIPATIITGFLGSGKTTLLNHMLTGEHGKRIAVIGNECAEVDINGSLVAANDIVMLNNGCLCCTMRGDLVRMIAELVNKKKGEFDHIVIETMGLANPGPIIQNFYNEDRVFNDVKLDGVVTLVDAKHAALHLDEVNPKGIVNEAVEQIAYADRIIVNKTDLVGEKDIPPLVQKIRAINSMAEMKRTRFGQVDLDHILGIGGFDLDRIETAVDVDGKKDDDIHDHDHLHHHHEHAHKHEHNNGHHRSHDHTHDPGVSSMSIVCEGVLDQQMVNEWLLTLVFEQSEDIYRIKGLLSIQGMDDRYVFQCVHHNFGGSPHRPWGPKEARINKIIIIGKNLNKEEIEKSFRACLM